MPRQVRIEYERAVHHVISVEADGRRFFATMATAQRLMHEEWAGLSWDEARLKSEAKGHPAKVGLAIAIRLKTTVSLAWLAERLHMGSPGYVSLLTRRDIKHKVAIH